MTGAVPMGFTALSSSGAVSPGVRWYFLISYATPSSSCSKFYTNQCVEAAPTKFWTHEKPEDTLRARIVEVVYDNLVVLVYGSVRHDKTALRASS